MRRLTAALALVAVVAAGALPALAQATTARQYADRADAICVDASAQLKKRDEPQTTGELLAYVRASRKLLSTALTRIAKIPLPTQKRSTALKLRRLGAEDLAVFSKYIAKLQSGAKLKPATNSFTRQLEQNAKREDAAWRSLGALKCAS